MIYIATVSLVLLALLTISMMIYHRHNSLLIAVLTPMLLFSTGFVWYAASSIMGYPTEQQIPTNSNLLYGYTDRPNIYLLVRYKGTPRLHTIPWSDKAEQKLAKAMSKLKQGKRMQVDRYGDNVQYKDPQIPESQRKQQQITR